MWCILFTRDGRLFLCVVHFSTKGGRLFLCVVHFVGYGWKGVSRSGAFCQLGVGGLQGKTIIHLKKKKKIKMIQGSTKFIFI